ncbi:hypothetical protein ACWEPM_11385 [Streptomyces sp. NPDC004244]|uniref:hypothetical protein n=1 Tax=Streptomyces sp. NPDC101206 TaxID=3366128 RepID=UPI00380FCDA4
MLAEVDTVVIPPSPALGPLREEDRLPAPLTDALATTRIDPDVLFVGDGDVLTSAGVAAGLDLCLRLVRRDHGSGIATTSPGCAWRHPGATAGRPRTSSAPCHLHAPLPRRDRRHPPADG